VSAIVGRSWVWRDEENRIEYAITIEDFDSNSNIITRLRLERFYRPLGSRYGNRHGYIWVIEFDAGELKVKWIEQAYEWNGTYTKTLAEMSIKTDFEEIPWFIDKDELEDDVGHHSVRGTMSAIFDYLRDIFTMALEEE
jgi:hypothetical protein